MSKLTAIQFTKTLKSDDIRKNYQLEYINKFSQTLLDNPSKPKKVVCNAIGISPSTLSR